MASPRNEKYLEKIYYDVVKQGYSSVTDIAISLNVSVSSVTKMVRKLSDEEYLEYKRYGKIQMTEKGMIKGEKLAYDYQVLEAFFQLIGMDQKHIPHEISCIKYHLSGNAIAKIRTYMSGIIKNAEIR
jgi:DtxR family transcriptional regulator, Mn-dependent transcriptional regulator